MNNIFDTEVSFFLNALSSTPKRAFTLKEWLTSEKYKNEVLAVRKIKNKGERDKLKAKTLPCITASGTYRNRTRDGLIKHSGFIALDFDNLVNPSAAKSEISNCENVAYCGLSASGRGLWALVPIADVNKHLEHFLFMEKAFMSKGLDVDTACKDITRLRFYSWDDAPYINEHAIPLEKWYRAPGSKRTQRRYSEEDIPHLAKSVEDCLRKLEIMNIDVTEDYGKWVAVGCDFAAVFGEDGRAFFHRVSAMYPGYSIEETHHKYNDCLNKRGYNNDLSTFFKLCGNAGIRYREIEALNPEYWNN